MASTLVLLRHAKSAYPTGVVDHDRPLNPRGVRDAPMAGYLIRQQVGEFDVALVSTATRAQQTWALSHVRATREKASPALYLASPEAMLRQVRAQDVRSLILVAHNPGTEDLAAGLTANPHTPLYARMLEKFPTAAFAVLRCDLPFAEWDFGCAELVSFEVGRG